MHENIASNVESTLKFQMEDALRGGIPAMFYYYFIIYTSERQQM